MREISDNAQKLLKKRYFLENENSWSDLCKRVSKNLASAETTDEDKEKWENIFYEKMMDLEIISSSPTLFNAGTISQQLSSCFIVSIEDNIESIFNTVAECAKIFQRCGGAGFNISKLRPKGFECKSSGSTASGVVSFMYIFNEVVNRIKQGNKRNGALKIDLDVDHPEIFDFIHCKDDITQLENMNISVNISNDFIKAVEENSNWDLKFNGVIKKTIKAIDLWNEIVEAAWKSGEPGLNWKTNMENGNMNPHISTEIGTNPCFTGDMKLLTEDGYKSFTELCGKEPVLINPLGNKTKGKVWSNGEKEIVKINFSNKTEIKCTKNHVFKLQDGEECEAKDLKGKKILQNINEFFDYNLEFIKFGFIQGDGELTRLSSTAHKGIEVNIGKDDKGVILLFEKDKYTEPKGNRRIYVSGLKNRLISLGFDAKVLPERLMPTSYNSWNIRDKASFLQGCFSANGSIVKSFTKMSGSRVTYKATCKEFLLQIQDTLTKDFDIYSYITTNKAKNITFKNGNYLCKESYDLNISRYEDIIKFHDSINFWHTYKKQSLIDIIIAKTPKVISIKEVGVEEVFDFTEPETHWGYVNGLVAHNCSEFVNIPYSSCNLSSINLSVMTTKDNKVDWAKLKDNTSIVMRMMDNTISVNRLPLPKIQQVTEDIRPAGIGTMGLADLMYKLKIPYNSQDGIDFINNLYEFIYDTTLEANILLAEERGVYPKWEGSLWDTKFNKKVRCSSMLSIAPNGSIAILADTTGGIEPNYSLVYYRVDNDGDKYFVVNTIFKRHLENKKKYDKAILEQISNNNGSIKGLDKLFSKEEQDIFVTASDISPEWHVSILATIQKHIDLACSKTVNLPSSATKEDVSKVYIRAAKLGIKGITVYRDGSRNNQVLSTKDVSNKDISKIILDSVEPIKRSEMADLGEALQAHSYQAQCACGKLYVDITYDDNNNLVETFIHPSKKGTCKANLDGTNRVISSSLRSGMKVMALVDQLKGIKCDACTRAIKDGKKLNGVSCPDILSKLIEKSYNKLKKIDKKEHIVDKNKCPDCGEVLQHSGGCVSCPSASCGWSKCL